MDARLYEKMTRIITRRLPYARMELGKARKRGWMDKAASWEREIARLNDLLRETEIKYHGAYTIVYRFVNRWHYRIEWAEGLDFQSASEG
jgi:hypothetical protein